MKIIQITNTYSGRVLEIVRSAVPEGFEIRLLSDNSENALLACIDSADYLLASGRVPIGEAALRRAGRLKMIQRTGVGLDSIDLAALKRFGIPLYVNRGVNAQSVAEHALLLMLACLRNLPTIDANTKNGIWDKQKQGVQTRELCGKTVGIIGMGCIGRTLAGLLKPFGTRVLYVDQFRLPEGEETALGATRTDLTALYRESDIISLHCPLIEETRHTISSVALGAMKRGVILINTARGGLINEADLIEALKTGRVGAAGLDVYEHEPVSRDNPLLANDRVITSPHVGGITEDSFYRMMHEAMNNIRRFDAGDMASIEENRYRG